jgi:hypothetical protein
MKLCIGVEKNAVTNCTIFTFICEKARSVLYSRTAEKPQPVITKSCFANKIQQPLTLHAMTKCSYTKLPLNVGLVEEDHQLAGPFTRLLMYACQ